MNAATLRKLLGVLALALGVALGLAGVVAVAFGTDRALGRLHG